MLAPGLATMLVRRHHRRACRRRTARPGAARGDRVTFDRLDSDGCMSTNDTVLLLACGASGVTPDPAAFAAAVREVCARPRPAAHGRRRGRHARHRDRGRGAAHEARRRRGRPGRRAQQPVQVRDLRRGPQLGPRPRRRRHHRRRLRPATGSTSRSTASGSAATARPADDRARSTCAGREVTITIDLQRRRAAATIWTNDLTADYVHENSAYST